jgi:hypothetical protein
VAISSKHGASVVPGDDDIEQMSLPTSKCPTRVSSEDIGKVTELLTLKKELLTICKAKIKSLKMDEGVASTKLLGIKGRKQRRGPKQPYMSQKAPYQNCDRKTCLL